MSSTIGYLLFSLATLIAIVNFYLSFVRAPIYRCLGLECQHVSGIPLLGSLFLIGALVAAEASGLAMALAIALVLLDTGGLIWLLLTFSWMALRRQKRFGRQDTHR